MIPENEVRERLAKQLAEERARTPEETARIWNDYFREQYGSGCGLRECPFCTCKALTAGDAMACCPHCGRFFWYVGWRGVRDQVLGRILRAWPFCTCPGENR